MTPEQRLDRFCDLVVRTGANVQPGQDVVIMYLVEHVPIARAVARAALAAGARRVLPYVIDLHLRKAAIELGPEDQLGHSPDYLLDWVRSWHETRPAIIQLSGDPEPELFSGLDPVLVAKAEPSDVRELYLPLVTRPARQLGDRPRPERGLGDGGARRAGRRAALGRGRDDDAPGRGRPGRGVAAPRGEPPTARGCAQRAWVRRGAVPRARHGPRRRAARAPPGGAARRSPPRAESPTSRTCRRRRSSRPPTCGAPKESSARPTP